LCQQIDGYKLITNELKILNFIKMRTNLKYTLKTALMLACVLPLAATAQEAEQKAASKDNNKEFYGRPSYWNPYDQRGINKFETSKAADTIPYEGLRIRFGAGFTQQFQSLKHENTALNNTGAGANKLYPLTPGFMTAQANLFTDVQLADGIRLNVTTYLSTRHHNEAWVKGGYIQFDKLPFNTPFFNKLMEIATIKVGHMEVNYGDAHFRRPDGGQTLQAPFIEGNIVDAFATEIGGEVYLQKNGLFGMLGVTNGMIKGAVDSVNVTKNASGVVTNDNLKRNPSVILKGGLDKQLNEKLRVRGSGSLYWNTNNAGSGLTLYSGDRAGSHYQNIMENKPLGTAYTAMYTSGRFNPGFSKNITAIMLNGFVKYGGLELFGTYETANGKAKTEIRNREMQQIAGDVLYRFGKNENLYVGGRYNKVNSELLVGTSIQDVSIDRTAFAAGWFVTPNVLLKGEVVQQNYKDFPKADFRNGGKFSGYVIEAVVGF
jgi:hypothetical protein